MRQFGSSELKIQHKVPTRKQSIFPQGEKRQPTKKVYTISTNAVQITSYTNLYNPIDPISLTDYIIPLNLLKDLTSHTSSITSTSTLSWIIFFFLLQAV